MMTEYDFIKNRHTVYLKEEFGEEDPDVDEKTKFLIDTVILSGILHDLLGDEGEEILNQILKKCKKK